MAQEQDRFQGGRKNRRVVLALSVVALSMVGLAYASVPLYQMFCQVTGYGGTPKTVVGERNLVKKDEGRANEASNRLVTVRFDANVNKALPWRFRPDQKQITLRLGEEATAYYTAKNVSNEDIIGTSTFNVTPHKAGQYFSKVQCFCFTEQRLKPGQEVSLPVSFFVDEEMVGDKNAGDVKTITLSYTFYRAKGSDGAKGTTDEIVAEEDETPGRPDHQS
jgi:cytochrome c oxidase assembly protein subunit 11